MTIVSDAYRVTLQGNNLERDFLFDFRCDSSTWLSVTVNGATQNYLTDYTVSLNANQDSSPGGTVSFTYTIGTGIPIVIRRTVPLEQPVVFRPYGPFAAKTVESGLDRLAMQDIQVTVNAAEAPGQAAAQVGTYLPGLVEAEALKGVAGVSLDLVEQAVAPDKPPVMNGRLYAEAGMGPPRPRWKPYVPGAATLIDDFMFQRRLDTGDHGRRWASHGGADLGYEGLHYGILSYGTSSARNWAATSPFTRAARRYNTGSAANGAVGWSGPAAGVMRVSQGAGAGSKDGFFVVMRFGWADTNPNAKGLYGVIASTTAWPAGASTPSTTQAFIGVGFDSGDTTLRFFHAGISYGTPVDLGANFPKGNSETDIYRLELLSPPTEAQVVYWRVTRENTGHVASGVAYQGANELPGPTVGLTQIHWRGIGPSLASTTAAWFSYRQEIY